VESGAETDFLRPLEASSLSLPSFDDKVAESADRGIYEVQISISVDIRNPFLDRDLIEQETPDNPGLMPNMILRAGYSFGEDAIYHNMPVTRIYYLDPCREDSLANIVAEAHVGGVGKLKRTFGVLESAGMNISGLADNTLIKRTPLELYNNGALAGPRDIKKAVTEYLDSLTLQGSTERNYRILAELSEL
jgi:hypothetical protein